MSNTVAQTLPGLFFNHFRQQKAVSKPTSPGNMAVWVLIYAELTEFALFFVIFLAAKIHNPEIFAEGPSRLSITAGMLNTLVLITSSFFVANAVAAIKTGNKKACLTWLWLCLLAGATYCGIKGWEYFQNESNGVSLRTDIFNSLYYYITFNHFLHVLIGMCTIFWVTLSTHFNVYSSKNHEGLESAALYWHMIDLAWIIIFPILYVLR